NCMDVIWTCNKDGKIAIENSGVEKSVNVVPIPCDIKKFLSYPGVLSDLRAVLGDSFVFYTIGEFTPRKNYEALIRAFNREFDDEDNVYLVVKTYAENPDSIAQYFNQIKAGMRMYSDPSLYKGEVIINHSMTEEEIYKLHCTGDCFV